MSFKKPSGMADNALDSLSRNPSYKGLFSFESIGDGPEGHNTRSMKHRLPSYLHTLRKQWGLSQPELARLLSITASALSRFEKRSRKPAAELLVAVEVMFGHPAKEVFPAFYHGVEREIVRRAKHELKLLETKTDRASRKLSRFFGEIVERASQTHLDL